MGFNVAIWIQTLSILAVVVGLLFLGLLFVGLFFASRSIRRLNEAVAALTKRVAALEAGRYDVVVRVVEEQVRASTEAGQTNERSVL